MSERFFEFLQSGSPFWFCALAGTGMFIIQFLMNLFGGMDHDGFDSDSGDFRKFKWFSLQAITGFLMVFGWTAITCQVEYALQNIPTLGIAIVAGLIAAYMIRTLFKFAKKLESPGNMYRIEDAIGKEAYVYQSIPRNGTGKISLSLNNLTHEIDALSYNSQEIPSFNRVKIIEKKDDRTVVVTLL